MRNKKGLHIFLIFWTATFFLSSFISACLTYDIVKIIIFSLIGVVITIVLNAILHELGHLILGKIVGLKLISIKILFLQLDFSSGKLKISFQKAEDLGETVFLPTTDKNLAKKVAISTFGGLLFTAIYLIFGMLSLSLFFSKNIIFDCFFALPTAVTLYYFLINLVGSENCDGMYIVNLLNYKGEDREITNNALYIGKLIYEGVAPKNIPHKYLQKYKLDYSLFSTMVIYYRYLSLIGVNEEYAIKEIYKISNRELLKDNLYDNIMCELYYVAYLTNDTVFLNQNKEIIEKIVDGDLSFYAKRAHIVLRLVTNDIDWANILINSTLKELDYDNLSGILELEKQMLEKIKTNMNK